MSLDTEFFSWRQSRPGGLAQQLELYPTRTNAIGFGPGRPNSIDGYPTPVGSVLALGIGYGVHKHLLFGARLGMNLSHLFDRNDDPDDDGNDDSSTGFVGTFTPYLEILPLSEGRVLPFILVRTGLTGARSTYRDGAQKEGAGSLSPQVGVGLGAHAFVTTWFSIDFGLTFDYRWTFARVRTINDPGPWVSSSQSFVLAATLGLSTWF